MPHHRTRLQSSAKALVTILSCLLLVGGCAEVGAPPGGIPDTVGPHLTDSYPKNGSLGVVPDSFIRLQFSETIVKPDQGSVVFISPRPVRPPEVKWKSNELLIKLPELFRANQTYVVSVSTSVTDLRRNKLDSTATIAFSTGQSIDSGLVAGQVWTPDAKPAVGWVVGLYPAGTLDNYQVADSIHPPYLTIAGSDGKFSLRHLPPGPFTLLAFEDKNRDEIFNPAKETFAVPDRDIVVGGPLKLDRLNLPGTQYDSLSTSILSAVITKDNLLRVRFNRKINPGYLAANSQMTTLRPDSDTLSPGLQCGGVAEAGPEPTDLVTLYFPGLADSIYLLRLIYGADTPPLVRDSVLVKFQTDKAPPEITAYQPGEKPLFLDQVKVGLSFSEPVKQDLVTDQSVTLLMGDKKVGCRRLWDNVFHLTLQPDRLEAGKKYRLDVTQFDIRDLAGNVLGDSLHSYSFATLDDDSVGSVAGVLLVNIAGKEDQTAILTLQEPATKRSFSVKVPPGPGQAPAAKRDFTLKVPPGRYLLSGFLDKDGDGRLTPGAIRPYRPAETQANYPDTIAVRARFESAGTQFIFD